MTDADSLDRLQALLARHPALLDKMKGGADPDTAADELVKIARDNGIALDAADLRGHFKQAAAKAHAPGALSDDALDDVAGGGTHVITYSAALNQDGTCAASF